MAQVQAQRDLSSIKDDEEFRRFASIIIGALVDTVNGGLEFDSNIRSQIVQVKFPVANAEVIVNHTLGFVPRGFIPISKSAAGDIYKSSTPWTTSTISLKCTGSVVAEIVIV